MYSFSLLYAHAAIGQTIPHIIPQYCQAYKATQSYSSQVIPATSATAERSFSCLRRVKTWLRSTMSQTRLNSMVILHENRLVLPHVDTVIDEFISLNDTRRKMFGLPNSSSCSVQRSDKRATASLLETDD